MKPAKSPPLKGWQVLQNDMHMESQRLETGQNTCQNTSPDKNRCLERLLLSVQWWRHPRWCFLCPFHKDGDAHPAWHSLCELSLCTASAAPCAAAWPLSWALDPHCCPSALCPNCHRHVHGCVCEFHTLISLHTLISVRQYHCQARHTEVLPDSSLPFIPRSKHCCL